MGATWSKHSSNLYHGHRRRARAAGVELPYDLGRLRELVTAAGPPHCRYCGDALELTETALDHATPLSRGGGWGLDNLAVCCRVCNEVKGQLTADEFVDLVKLLLAMCPLGEADIRRRLRFGGRLYRRGGGSC